MPATFTVAEVAELAGVGRETLYRELNETGQVMGVRGLKIRARWLIPKAPIVAILHLGDSHVAVD